MTDRRALEPLLFERSFKPKEVWGGRALERVLGIELPANEPIGETWELVDRAEETSVVRSGAFRGTSLRELMQTRRDELLGSAKPSREGGFPLLVKFLDAKGVLSVQVHPHRMHASRLPKGDFQKTECWYILDAQDDSAIYLGLKPSVDEPTLRRCAGTDAIVDLLVRHPVKRGDFFFVPGGTVHAIGAGVVLVEVQETSDTTYRLYDWGRTESNGRPRKVHVEEALKVARFGEPAEGARARTFDDLERSAKRALLTDCDEFTLELVEFERSYELALRKRDSARIYIVFAGRGTLRVGERAAAGERYELAPGDTWLIPASLGAHVIEGARGLGLLQVTTK